MTPKKILLYIESASDEGEIEKISRFTMDLAKQYDARVFALVIIKSVLDEVPQVKSRSEEQAWKRLYEIEEDAFESEVKISLLLEEIKPMNRHALTQKLISVALTFQVELLILSSKAKLNFKKLTSETIIPIVIVPTSG